MPPSIATWRIIKYLLPIIVKLLKTLLDLIYEDEQESEPPK